MADAGRQFAVTPLQAGMAFNAATQPHSGVDVQHVEVSVTGAFSAERWESAWRQVIDAVAILRGCFSSNADAVSCVDAGAYQLPVDQVDLSGLSSAESELRWSELVRADRVKGFDLHAAPLMRFVIASPADGQTRILWSFHHAILDGRSFPIVLDLVLGVYLDGAAVAENPSRAFEDFVSLQAELDTRPALDAWASRLAAVEDTSTFNLRSPEPVAESGPAVSAVEAHLEGVQSAHLVAMAHELDVSINNVIQASWGLLLHHYSQNETVIFGTTRACRLSLIHI